MTRMLTMNECVIPLTLTNDGLPSLLISNPGIQYLIRIPDMQNHQFKPQKISPRTIDHSFTTLTPEYLTRNTILLCKKKRSKYIDSEVHQIPNTKVAPNNLKNAINFLTSHHQPVDPTSTRMVDPKSIKLHLNPMNVLGFRTLSKHMIRSSILEFCFMSVYVRLYFWYFMKDHG